MILKSETKERQSLEYHKEPEPKDEKNLWVYLAIEFSETSQQILIFVSFFFQVALKYQKTKMPERDEFRLRECSGKKKSNENSYLLIQGWKFKCFRAKSGNLC